LEGNFNLFSVRKEDFWILRQLENQSKLRVSLVEYQQQELTSEVFTAAEVDKIFSGYLSTMLAG
jgi:hypothetical protein